MSTGSPTTGALGTPIRDGRSAGPIGHVRADSTFKSRDGIADVRRQKPRPPSPNVWSIRRLRNPLHKVVATHSSDAAGRTSVSESISTGASLTCGVEVPDAVSPAFGAETAHPVSAKMATTTVRLLAQDSKCPIFPLSPPYRRRDIDVARRTKPLDVASHGDPFDIVIRPRRSRSPGSLCRRRTAGRSVPGTPTAVRREGLRRPPSTGSSPETAPLHNRP